MQSTKLATIRRTIRNSFIHFVAPITCPKCSSSCRTNRACPRCGLAAERMSTYVRQEQPVDDTLTRAWAAVTAAWDVPALHDELLRLTTQHDAWAWAAARYREASRTRAGDQIALNYLRRLEKGIVVSTMGLAQAREDKMPKPYRAATTMLVILIVVLVAGFVYSKAVRRPGAPATPATSTAAQMVGVR
jgi:ribosomal protein L32